MALLGEHFQKLNRATDTTGRPLTQMIDAGRMPLNYIPGREGTLTDKAAFKEFAQNRHMVEGAIQWVRSQLPAQTLDLMQLWLLSVGLHRLPAYLLLRRENPLPPDQLPPSLIDIYRTAAGFMSVFGDMIQNQTHSPNAILSAEEIYAFANGENPWQRNFFRSRDLPVSCPAPEPVVMGILKDLIHKPATPVDTAGMDWAGALTLADVPTCLGFAPAFEMFVNAYDSALEVPASDPKFTESVMYTARGYLVFNQALGYPTASLTEYIHSFNQLFMLRQKSK